MGNDNKTDETLLKGIQAGIAATEYLCEITEALELDSGTANIDTILHRIYALIKIEVDVNRPKIEGDA